MVAMNEPELGFLGL